MIFSKLKYVLSSWGLFFAVILIDQYSKHSFTQSVYFKRDPDSFLNKAFIGGSGEELSMTMRIALFTAVFGPLFCGFAALISWIWKSDRFLWLRVLVSIIMGGATSNVIDKMLNGGVIDFIPLRFNNYLILMNVADIFLQGAVIILMITGIFQWKKWLQPDDSRGRILVNQRFQFFYAFKMSLLSLVTCVVMSILSLAYITIITKKLEVASKSYIYEFMSLWFLMTLGLIVVICALSFYFSHQIVGPIIALQRYIRDLEAGRDHTMVLRKDDQLKEIEQVAKMIRPYLKRAGDFNTEFNSDFNTASNSKKKNTHSFFSAKTLLNFFGDNEQKK